MARWLLSGWMWLLVGIWAVWDLRTAGAPPVKLEIAAGAVFLIWVLGAVPRLGPVLQALGSAAAAVFMPAGWTLCAVALSAGENLRETPVVTLLSLGVFTVIAVRMPDPLIYLGVLLPLIPAFWQAYVARRREEESRVEEGRLSELEAQVAEQRQALLAQKEHNDSLKKLMRADQETHGNLEPDRILELIPRHAAAIAHASTCLLYWRDERTGSYVLRTTWGPPGNYPQSLEFDEAKQTVKSGVNLRIPLVIDGRLWGCLIILGKQTEVAMRTLRGSFTEEDWSFAAVYANSAMADLSVALAHNEMRRMALTDMLTGVYNRQYFMRRLKEEIARAQRYGEMFSVVFFDIDHFKKFNDTWGHQAGDETLCHVARVTTEWARESDVFARWGGEEFVILLPRTNKDQARIAAERLRQRIAESPTQYGAVTVSMGVATFPADSREALDLINRADEAAYQSKTGGRNRVTCYSASGSDCT